MNNITVKEKINGGILGLLVGDALGVPYEFRDAKNIPPIENIEYIPPENFPRSHKKILPGTWSDDGSQALCLLTSLLDCNRLDLNDFAKRLVNWYDNGYLAVDDCVFDVGNTTATAILSLKEGVSPYDAGPFGSYDNGNGSLMRCLPLALWHRGSDKELVLDAQLQSYVTHGHLRSQVCCALYCLWARYELYSLQNSFEKAVKTLREIYKFNFEALQELDWSIRPDDEIIGTGSGYVVDSLRSAKDSLQQNTYQDVVRYAIKLGKDTDTTACIAGGIAGIKYGINGIPIRWRDSLRGKEIYKPILDNFNSYIDNNPL
jgi:ADP-ribosylglycohydrolase